MYFLLPKPRMEGLSRDEISLTKLYFDLAHGLVSRMEWQGSTIDVELKDGEKLTVRAFTPESPAGRDLIQAAVSGNADLRILGVSPSATLLAVLSVIGFPLMIIALIYFLLIRPMRGARISRMELEIKRIMDRLTATGGPTTSVQWEVGNELIVFDGPFKGHRGKAVAVDPERQIIKAMLDIFGRDTPVELHFDEVQKL